MASKDQLPLISHGMHPNSGKGDVMHRVHVNGKAPLNGLATPNLWAGIPGPLISNTGSLGHGHKLCCASLCTLLPLWLDKVAPKSTSLTHNVLVKIPFAPLVIAMYGPHAKMQNRSVLMMLATMGHDFSGMGDILPSRRDGAE